MNGLIRTIKTAAGWSWKALQYNEGMFDPRNRDVVEAEPHFDFTIEEEWARYNYDLEGRGKIRGEPIYKRNY